MYLFVKIATVVRMPEERLMEGSGIFGCMEEADLMAGSNGASQVAQRKQNFGLLSQVREDFTAVIFEESLDVLKFL